MLTVLSMLVMMAGAALWSGLSRGRPWAGKVRWVHRGLALLVLAYALGRGGTLIAGSVAIVGTIGIGSARVRDRSLALLLFACHLVGAVSLLILVGLARSFSAY